MMKKRTSRKQEQEVQRAVDLLLFGFLDFTVVFCAESTNTASTSSLLQSGVRNLAEHVVPPPLDLDLALADVSQKWKDGASRKQCTRR